MELFVGSIALYNNFKSIVLICINKISTTSLVFNNDKLSAKILVSEHFWFLVTARNTIIVNIKAGKRGGGGQRGQNTWGQTGLGGPKS